MLELVLVMFPFFHLNIAAPVAFGIKVVSVIYIPIINERSPRLQPIKYGCGQSLSGISTSGV